ncbi:hypothetical protein MLD38_000649 [Melastoma candidum]|uniref:Uncharacterized protein n=1 Tax=Melastoma candidum TaxID=119954 RepID=A0ACB9SC14_9MYRT|nr:hypothetical protein MLD38_000649 [Melastoma candidum]
MAGSTDSSAGSPRHPHLPPGFRFHPTDEELVVHYLKKKASASPLPVSIIAEVDIYKFDPWELPAKATYGEQEWYFFSPRDRKYPNGARPNRAATSGYWKATGTDKPVMSAAGNQKVGVKKALVFYGGKPPKGSKTSWIMHEYRLVDNKPNNRPPGIDFGKKKNSLRLDDWVLCRIYKKNSIHRSPLDHDRDDSADDIFDPFPPPLTVAGLDRVVGLNLPNKFPPRYIPLFDNSHPPLYGGMLSSIPLLSPDTKPESTILQALPSDPSSHLLPMKRPLPSTPYYRDEKDQSHMVNPSGTLPEGNRQVYAQEEGSSGNDPGSSAGIIASLLSQIPQSSSVFASLGGDAPDHLPRDGLNWYAN